MEVFPWCPLFPPFNSPRLGCRGNLEWPLPFRHCVSMESSCEGTTGEDSVSPRWAAGCGSGFYRHVSHVFGDTVLGTAGQKGGEYWLVGAQTASGGVWPYVAAAQLRDVLESPCAGFLSLCFVVHIVCLRRMEWFSGALPRWCLHSVTWCLVPFAGPVSYCVTSSLKRLLSCSLTQNFSNLNSSLLPHEGAFRD